MKTRAMPQAAVYLLDQDRRTTSSLGIFHYSANLVRGIAESPFPGFEVVLWVSSANRDAFVPAALPSWMRVVCVDGAFGTGFRRLAADHGIAPWLARSQRPDLIHFPKGFLPLWLPRGIRRLVTIHDTIIPYYRQHYPDYFPRLKTAYFDALLRRSLRRSDHVITVSAFSAQCLARLSPRCPPLTVIPSTGFNSRIAPPERPRNGIMVIGSSLPHKATAETLRRLDAYALARGFSERVTVSGIGRLDDIPGFHPPLHLSLDVVGRLPFGDLMERIAASRALVVLSEIEGFGLPLLESYSVNTPVCFRNVASMAEVLEGLPGGWDGVSDASFAAALDACLQMPASQLATIRDVLAARYSWKQSVADTVAVYRGLLPGDAGGCP
jgi:glycosyltransferase involved in cell wall biosynthesis